MGRLNPAGLLGGNLQVDAQAAREGMLAKIARPLGYNEGALHDMTAGVLSLAAITMAGAIKRVTLERGEDPREFTLFAYGGGGPLHAAELAAELHIPLVIVPPHAGNFSAVGMLLADIQQEASTTFLTVLDQTVVEEIDQKFAQLEEELAQAFENDFNVSSPLFERQIELRYRGQMHSIRVTVPGACPVDLVRSLFEKSYGSRFGHVDRKAQLETVGLRSIARASSAQPRLAALTPSTAQQEPAPHYRDVYFASAGCVLSTPVFQRGDLGAGHRLAGPALIEDYGATILAGPSDSCEIGDLGEVRIHIGRTNDGIARA